MAEYSRFFDHIDGDRTYNADDFAEYFRQILTTGVLDTGDNLQVYVNGADRVARIKTGQAWIEGYYYKLTEEITFQLDEAHGTYDRIDRIVLRLDINTEARNIKLFVKTGTPATNPTAPTLTRDNGIYEISLAQILVVHNTTAIPAGKVTDERLNSEVCGLANLALDYGEFALKVDTGNINDETLPTELKGKSLTEQTKYILASAGKVNTVNNKTPDANKNIQLVPADIGALPEFSVSSIDFNNLTTPGVYAIRGGTNTNAPSTESSLWGLIVLNSRGNNYVQQIAFPEEATEIYIRRKQATWYPWEILSLRQKSPIIGEGAQGYTSGNNNTVTIGKNAKTDNDGCIAIGSDAMAGASTAYHAIAIGQATECTGDGAIALGNIVDAYAPGSVAIGDGARSDAEYTGVLGVASSASNFGASKWKVPGDFTVSGSKTFEIPHPKPEKEATHVIRHACVESPTAGDTLYRWKITAEKENDVVTIGLPDYFIYLNRNVQVFVTPQGHFGNGYGVLNEEAEQIEVRCQFAGEYNVLCIGTRNDDNPTIQNWGVKGVEREIGEDWNGEAVPFDVDEITEVVEIEEKEES